MGPIEGCLQSKNHDGGDDEGGAGRDDGLAGSTPEGGDRRRGGGLSIVDKGLAARGKDGAGGTEELLRLGGDEGGLLLAELAGQVPDELLEQLLLLLEVDVDLLQLVVIDALLEGHGQGWLSSPSPGWVYTC